MGATPALQVKKIKPSLEKAIFCLLLTYHAVQIRFVLCYEWLGGGHGNVHFRQVLERWCELVLVVCHRHI